MKDYRQLLKELPSSTIVCALGEFNPPTIAHELLVKTVKVVAEQKNADHTIFTSPSNLISEEKKEHFLKLMFPTTKFQSLGESFFSSSIKQLSEKYRKVVIIAGADQFAEFKKLKESANVEIISIGDKDPDVDGTKMKQFATKGLYEDFKKLLPSTIRDIDGKRLMNEMRYGLELDPIKEQINLVKDKLREKYFRGEIFNIGDIVESDGKQFEIVKRGSNHLLLKEESGQMVSKWITDVKLVKEGVIQPNGTDKVETNSPESAGNNQQIPNKKGKIKGFLTFYNYDDKTKNVNEQQLPVVQSEPDEDKDNESDLDTVNGVAKVFDPTHVGHSLVQSDTSHHVRRMKIKHHLGEESLDEQLPFFGNNSSTDNSHDKEAKAKIRASLALKQAKEKENLSNKHKKEKLALQNEAIEKDKKKKVVPQEERPGISTETKPFLDPFFKEDITETEIDQLIDTVTDQDIEDLYEEDEIVLVYEDTGEEVESHPDEAQIDLMEVLSRQERMKGKIRLRKTKAKRERSTKIALKKYSDPSTINKRARRMAIKLMKKRMLRGRNPATVSVGEKERVEKAIASKKDQINRIATKLVPRIRKVEKARMSHGKVTKGKPPAVI